MSMNCFNYMNLMADRDQLLQGRKNIVWGCGRSENDFTGPKLCPAPHFDAPVLKSEIIRGQQEGQGDIGGQCRTKSKTHEKLMLTYFKNLLKSIEVLLFSIEHCSIAFHKSRAQKSLGLALK